MATSVVSSPVRSARTAGSPGFRSQRKLSAGIIVKKIQTLEDAIQSLRQQLVFARSEEDVCPDTQKEVKKPKEIKQQKETKETKQKKTQESKEEEKIPMPWTGQVDFAACVGLKAQYGLFIQCAKTCDMKTASFQIDNHECRFCSDCSKKCDENGKHPVGTIEERIESGVGKYVNAKTGKRETIYIEVLEKMKITKEQALESAQRRGFQIPDWMLEKAEKKRGRPAATVGAATIAAAAPAAALANDTGNDETKTNETKNTKEKKPRQPRAKATTKAATTKASAATQDTPQKKNSAQSSICIDLNNDDESVTPVAIVADAASVASVASAPQENEKKKRGRPTKSNTQNNIGESEMQQLIAQATTEKKKRLSLDAADAHTSEEGDQIQVETHLTFEENENGNEQEQLGEDEIFEMFDKMLENEEQQQEQQEKQQQEQQEPVVTVATKEKKGKSEKKAKKSDDKEKVEKEKISKKEAAALKKAQEEAALKKAQEETALKKAQEEAALKKAQEEAALKKAQEEEEDDNETVDEEEEESNEEEEEELECEEYEYDGETYGLAPNGDIYSQDGDLVGKLTNGVPNMFN
jgi:hypothetical protein